jgi:aryl-alcohol dehydrogenase-like predicted oxidoreductase
VRAGIDYVDYDGVIAHAAAHDVGVAVIRPLAGGALSRQVVEGGAAGRHRLAGGILTRRPEFFAPDVLRGRPFAFLERSGRTLAQAATIFNVMPSAITTVLGGYSDRAQLEEIVACSGAPPLSPEELARIDAIYARNFDLSD